MLIFVEVHILRNKNAVNSFQESDTFEDLFDFMLARISLIVIQLVCSVSSKIVESENGESVVNM